MNTFLRLLLFFAVLVCISSCEFTPSGDHLVNVEKKAPTISIELNGNQDTIVIKHSNYNLVSFNFSSTLKGLNPIKSTLFVDEKPILTRDGFLGAFDLDLSPEKYQRGFHTVRLELITNSGTGSLADKTGAELFVSNWNWTLNVDLDPPDAVTLQEALPQKGMIKLKWTPYTRINFSAYRVIASSYMASRIVATITDPAITQYFDSLYIGGDVRYRVEIATPYPDRYSYSNEIRVSYPSPAFLTAEAIGSDKVKLTWSACQFRPNFGKYRISGGPTDLNIVISNPEDTTLILDNIPFGKQFDFYLTTIDRKSELPTNHENLDLIRFATGTKIDAFLGAYFSKAHNSLYLRTRDEQSLNRYDGNTYEQTSSRKPEESYGFQLSPLGQYLYVVDRQSLIRIDPVTLKNTQLHPLTDFLNGSPRLRTFAVSDNNTIAIQGYASNNVNSDAVNGVMIWDVMTKKLFFQDADWVSQRKLGPLLRPSSFSSSGTYLLNDSLYHLDNQQLKGVSVHESEYFHIQDYFFTSTTNEDQLIEVYANTITLRTCSTGTIAKRFTTTERLVEACLDPVSGYLGGVNPERTLFSVYDVTSGTLVKQVPITNNSYILLNNTLFNFDGYYLKL